MLGGRAIRTKLQGIGLALLVAAGVAAVEFLRGEGLLRLRVALIVHLAVIGLALALAGRRLFRPAIVFLFLAGGLTAVTVAADAMVPPGPDYYAAQSRLIALLAGFAIVSMFMAVAASRDEVPPPEPDVVSRGWPVVVFIAALVILTALKASTRGDFDLGLDEITFVLQSRWLREPGFGVAYDPEIIRQAQLPYTYVRDGHLYGQYPPGWPFAIALANGVGLYSFTAAILGAVSVALCFAIARQRLGLAAGFAAAVLLLFQPWFWELHRGLMSHELTITLSLLAAWLVLRASRSTRHRGPWLILAGVAAGWVTAARPLTGVAIFAGLVIWKWLSEGAALRSFTADTLFLAGGAVVPVLFLLGYNLATTGDPFRFGYDIVHGKFHALGFGRRGFVHGMQLDFTPAVSLQSTSTLAQNLGEQAIGLAFLLPVVAITLARRVSVRWRMIVPLLVLPFVNFFYFGNYLHRLYIEIVPFVIVAWVALVLRLRVFDRPAFVALVAAAVTGNALVARRQKVFEMADNVSVAVKGIQERAKQERLVVLIDTLGAPHGQLWQFFAVGGTPRSAAPLVFYSGAADSAIVTRFRDRVPVQVRWAGPDVPPAVGNVPPTVHRQTVP